MVLSKAMAQVANASVYRGRAVDSFVDGENKIKKNENLNQMKIVLSDKLSNYTLSTEIKI